MTTHLVDRSRIIAGQKCMRDRYWNYHHLGTGIQRVNKGLPLIFGSAFHDGVEILMTSDKPDKVDAAVMTAQLFMAEQWVTSGIDLSEEAPTVEAVKFAMGEQAALVEALLRGWASWEGEHFFRTFEVVECEQEGRATLLGYGPDDIVLMFRPDALLRERDTGDFYVLSWKTTSMIGKWTMEHAKVDMQSMSEVFGVENDDDLTSPPKIEGVLYRHLLKGQRRKDEWDGIYKQGSHLIYGWRNLKDGDWSWAYSYPKEDGTGGESRLGKGWKKVPIWQEYEGGVKQWIDDLSNNRVFPRHGEHPLEKAFPQSLPIERRAGDIESWRRQTVAEELRIIEAEKRIENVPVSDPQFRILLDSDWPQTTAACYDFNRPCAFWDACHVPAVAEDPLASGLYKIRSANHPEYEGEE